jgi:AcrR family transcriptional regulator
MGASSQKADTRAALLRAAEQLFAAHGVEGVSLREINRAAGQANASALQYHFVDRGGLLRGVIDKHRVGTEARRHALLDQYEASGVDDLRAMANALILPLASKLDDADGGREYLQINCEVYTRPDFDKMSEMVPSKGPRNSIRRWHAMLDPVLPVEEKTRLHSRFPAMRFAFVELARRAADRPRRDDRLFASHLADLVTALLVAPPSPQTTALLDQRSSKRAAGAAARSSKPRRAR